MKQSKKEVVLDNQQRKRLEKMLTRGRWSPREMVRVKILLTAANQKQKLNQTKISKKLECCREKVGTVINRYIENNDLDEALFEKPRSGQPKKLDGKDEAFVIATACSKAPRGNDHWTLEMLQKRAGTKRKKNVCINTIRKVLLSNDLRPWEKKDVVHTGC